MSYLSMTRLKLKSPRYLIRFWNYNEKIVRQMQTAEGFLQGKLLANYSLAMWTTTLWTSSEALKEFYLNGSHQEVIARISEWSSEAVHFSKYVSTKELPSWQQIGSELAHQGRFQELKQPSLNQQNKVVLPPKFVNLVKEVTATQIKSYISLNK